MIAISGTVLEERLLRSGGGCGGGVGGEGGLAQAEAKAKAGCSETPMFLSHGLRGLLFFFCRIFFSVDVRVRRRRDVVKRQCFCPMVCVVCVFFFFLVCVSHVYRMCIMTVYRMCIALGVCMHDHTHSVCLLRSYTKCYISICMHIQI